MDGQILAIKKTLLQYRNSVAAVMPEGTNVDAALTAFIGLVSKSKLLAQCTPQSLVQVLREASAAGLELSTFHRYLAVVPFWNSAKKAYEATIIPQYQGLRELIRRHPDVMKHKLDCVHEGDHFEYLGDDEKPMHRHDINGDRLSRPVLFAYVWAEFVTGEIRCLVWSIDQILAHRNRYSKSWAKAVKDGDTESPDVFWSPASRSFSTMCAKTVLRAAVGSGDIPMTTQKRQILMADDVIDVTPTQVTSEPAAALEPPIEIDEPEQIDEVPETVAETESNWKTIFATALANQTNKDQIKEVYQSIREISDQDPDDAIWAEQQYKARIKEVSKK